MVSDFQTAFSSFRCDATVIGTAGGPPEDQLISATNDALSSENRWWSALSVLPHRRSRFVL